MGESIVFFLVGSCLAIPMSVIANLVIPRVEDWRARNNPALRKAQAATLRDELLLLESLVTDNSKRLIMLSESRQIWLAICWVSILISNGITFGLVQYIEHANIDTYLVEPLLLVNHCVTLIFGMIFLNAAVRSLMLNRKLYGFDHYKDRAKERIRELETAA